MPVEIEIPPEGSLVRLHASGRLTRDDYLAFVPRIEQAITHHGKVRVLFDICGLKGWSTGAAWEDIKFAASHFRDLERIAAVGDRAWEKWMMVLIRPFTSARVRYFDQDDSAAAEAWVNAPVEPGPDHGPRWLWMALGRTALLAAGLHASQAGRRLDRERADMSPQVTDGHSATLTT